MILNPGILFWLLIALCVVSLIPVSFGLKLTTPSLWLPAIAPLVYYLYEKAAAIAIPPEDVPIRVDLIFVYPMLAVIFVSGFARWVIFTHLWATDQLQQNKLAIQLQLFTVVPIFIIIAFAWFAKFWWFI